MTLAGQQVQKGESGNHEKQAKPTKRMTHEEQQDDALLRYLDGVSLQLFRLLDFDGQYDRHLYKSRSRHKPSRKSVVDVPEANSKPEIGTRGRKPRQSSQRKVAVNTRRQAAKRRQSRQKVSEGRSGEKLDEHESIVDYDRLGNEKLNDNMLSLGLQHPSKTSHTDHEGQLALSIGDELSNQLEAQMVSESMTPTRAHLSPIDSSLAQLSGCNTPSSQHHLQPVSSYFGSQRLNGQQDEFNNNVGGAGDELLGSLFSSTNRAHHGQHHLVLPLALVDDASSALMHPLGETCYESGQQLYAPTTFHHSQADYHHQQQHHHQDQHQIEGNGQHQWLGPMMSCHPNTINEAPNSRSSTSTSSANSLTTVTSAMSSHGQLSQHPSTLLVHHPSQEHHFTPIYQSGYYTSETHALNPSADFSDANQSSHSQTLMAPIADTNRGSGDSRVHQRAGAQQSSATSFESNQQQQILPATQNYHEQAQAQHYSHQATRHHDHHYQAHEQTFHQSHHHQHRELHNHHQQQAQQVPQVIHHQPHPHHHHHHHHHHMVSGLEGGIEPSSVILQDINLASATWVSPEDLYSI